MPNHVSFAGAKQRLGIKTARSYIKKYCKVRRGFSFTRNATAAVFFAPVVNRAERFSRRGGFFYR